LKGIHPHVHTLLVGEKDTHLRPHNTHIDFGIRYNVSSTLLVVEKGYTLMLHPAGGGKGYTLMLHPAGCWWWKRIHPHVTPCWWWKRIHPHVTPCWLLVVEKDTPSCYTLLVEEKETPSCSHPAGGGKRYTLMAINTLTEERDTTSRPHCWWWKGIH
jgi:hypothetical protein